MQIRRAVQAALVLCVLCLTGNAIEAQQFCRSAPSAPVSLEDAFGVNIDFTEPRPGELRMLAGAGFRWVRMDLKWDVTEVEKGRYDFAAYDHLLSALEQENVRALFILDYGNPLYDDGAPPSQEETRKAFVRWATAAAKHFAGHGILWEVYNEPNHEQFWPPMPNVSDYAALALAVGRAFEKEIPNEKLIGPAVSGVDLEFLEACFRRGLLRYWSGISVHPYRREGPETAAADYCRIRELIARYAPTSEKATVPIIAGEWGYSAAWQNVSVEKQGELLARSWLTNVASGVALSVWYDWKDDGLDPQNPEHNFGTVANNYFEHSSRPYDPKPAYLAASTLTRFFSGFSFSRRVLVGSGDDFVLVFRKGAEVRFAVWTTARIHEVVIPSPTGEYRAVEYSGKAVSTYRSSNNRLIIKLGNIPFYIKKID